MLDTSTGQGFCLSCEIPRQEGAPATDLKEDAMDATNDFFAGSPSFKYNRSASLPQEFNRLRGQFHWDEDWQGEYS
jgi:hypothetical protein